MSIEGAVATKLVSVPHLGGTKISYAQPKPISPSKPTLILINPILSSATFFKPQLNDESLTNSVNLIALVPLGHGLTTTPSPVFTYWDSAIAFLQAMDSFGVKKAIVLGSSQGGWIAARMALLAPDQILGIIPINSTMDSNSPRLVELGSLDLATDMKKNIVEGMKDPNPKWTLPEGLVKSLVELSVGPNPSQETLNFNYALGSKHYSGDSGRRKLREIAIGLISRDSLYVRLDAIKCPVLWIRGSEDKVFTEDVAKEDLALFGSSNKKLETVSGAYHSPTLTHANETNQLIIAFVKKYGGKPDARGLREAVGMVDI